ncbi:MAG TPA: MFS transporter, partial [Rhizomicrobium sp.]|nr:MFS transporter [Rhizomicrobium sp.]
AALTMNKDLGLTPTVFGLAGSALSFAYLLCEIPSNLILERVGARKWLARIMITWGVASAATMFATGPWSLAGLRALVGIAEAGFAPGLVLYMTYWYPQYRRASAQTMFMLGQPLAGMLSATVGGFILGLNGTWGLHGWQWLFLIEGAPAVLLSFSVLACLPDGPADARWLSAAEKAQIGETLARESLPKEDLWAGVINPAIWILGIADIGIITTHYGIGLWLPLLVKATGLTAFQTGCVVAIPYVLALAAMLAWARSSDVRRERVFHVVAPALLAAAGLFAAGHLDGGAATIVALSVVVVSTYSALVVFWTFPPSFLGGTAAAGGIALVNAIGNLGGFFGPYLVGWLKDRTGGYAAGMNVLAAGLIVTAFTVYAFSRSRRAPAMVG